MGAWIETSTSLEIPRTPNVAPYMGAWIEKPLLPVSLPTWGRGLKLRQPVCEDDDGQVAPYMGAWIETDVDIDLGFSMWSLPTWGRGLKHIGTWVQVSRGWSLPTWGRGLKLVWRRCMCVPIRSLPTWGRGLKQIFRHTRRENHSSLPTWGRGLKQDHSRSH